MNRKSFHPYRMGYLEIEGLSKLQQLRAYTCTPECKQTVIRLGINESDLETAIVVTAYEIQDVDDWMM